MIQPKNEWFPQRLEQRKQEQTDLSETECDRRRSRRARGIVHCLEVDVTLVRYKNAVANDVMGFSRGIRARRVVFEAISEVHGGIVPSFDDLLMEQQSRESDLKADNIALADLAIDVDGHI